MPAKRSTTSKAANAKRPTSAQRLQTLRTIPLFSGLTEKALRGILATSTEFEVPSGHVLVEAGHPGSGLFVVEEGTVEVRIGSKRIALGPGDFFGELALLTPGALHAGRVSATSDVRALAIGRGDFQVLLREEPKVALAMLETLAARLANSQV